MKKSAANDGDDGDVKDVHDLLVMLQIRAAEIVGLSPILS